MPASTRYNRVVKIYAMRRCGNDTLMKMAKAPERWIKPPTSNNNQITQNNKDLLSSGDREYFENSDFIYMLNQASGDRQILAKQLNISPTQLSYVTNSNEGEGLLFYGNVIIPFVDRFLEEFLYKSHDKLTWDFR